MSRQARSRVRSRALHLLAGQTGETCRGAKGTSQGIETEAQDAPILRIIDIPEDRLGWTANEVEAPNRKPGLTFFKTQRNLAYERHSIFPA